jgi:aminotransferase
MNATVDGAGTAIDTVDLSGDDLGLHTAPHIREAAKLALDEGATHYTTRPGLDPLREAVSRKLRDVNGIEVDPKAEVIVTSGTQEALFVTLNVLLEPGDEALVPRPSRAAYVDIVRAAGGVVRAVHGDPSDEFALDPQRLARRVGPRTRVLLLGSPLAPTGAVHSRETLQRVAEIAIEHNLTVIADEAGEPFVMSGEHLSIGSLPGMAERTITINGFSTGYAMNGWRVGYMVGPRALIGSMMKLKQALSICSAAVSQYAALAAMTGTQEPLQEARAAVAARREATFAALDRAGIPHVRPQAGFHVLLRNTGTDAPTVSEIEETTGVRLAPGRDFGAPSWLRLSLTQPPDVLRAAIGRLDKALTYRGAVFG